MTSHELTNRAYYINKLNYMYSNEPTAEYKKFLKYVTEELGIEIKNSDGEFAQFILFDQYSFDK